MKTISNQLQEQIKQAAIKDASIRQISRNLGLSPDTV